MAVNSFRRSPASPGGRNRGIYLAAIVIGTAALIAFQFAKRLPREEVGSHIAGHIVVVDGDTVRVNGQPYRLSGLDTPERGDRARCEGELRKAEEAAGRLRQLVAVRIFSAFVVPGVTRVRRERTLATMAVSVADCLSAVATSAGS